MSSGLIKFNGSPPPVLALSSGKPSTTNNGVLPLRTLPGPRIVMLNAPPGSPVAEVTFTPATFPCNNCWGELIIPLLKDSLFKDLTGPVTSFLLCVP